MALPDASPKISYRTGRDDLVRDFFVPCLGEAVLYRRSAGYFTSHGLALAARGVAQLVARGGRMRLVVSPHLVDEDVQALERAKDQEEALRQIAARSLEEIENELVRRRLEALAWLAATGHLEVRLALRLDANGGLGHGLYHEKTGIFTDLANNHVAFSGSSNETAGGLVENFESLEVFCSWKDPEGRIVEKLENFESLWCDQTPGLKVIEFSSVAKSLLEKYKVKTPPFEGDSRITAEEEAPGGEFSVPPDVVLRGYQTKAIASWFKANGRGIFKMATGSGKTITSIATAAKLHEKVDLDALIIVCPYRHLVTQWEGELRRFKVNPVLAFESRESWLTPLNSKLALQYGKYRSLVVVVTTNSTFASDAFQSCIRSFPEKTMMIADEVHNLGASDLRTKLPSEIRFRLGLSATPERHHDLVGTAAIFDYFGGVLEPEFSLKDALDAKALVPYRYHPILVELTAEEAEQYEELSLKISKLAMIAGSVSDPAKGSALDILLAQRSRLIACAANKLPALAELMSERREQSQLLVYCGDGRVEEEPDGQLIRQIEAVCRLLGRDLRMKVASFVAETSLEEREILKSQLRSGALQGLVAIRCLDEGVDIPSVTTAVLLASSTNPRQFIQRRGRILRRDDQSGKRSAEIFDMIVVPPPIEGNPEWERSLLRNELLRFMEFASLALNSGEARGTVLEIQSRYELLHL